MLVFVDCEAYGGAPVTGQLTEFGAVVYEDEVPVDRLRAFHGIIIPTIPSKKNPAVPKRNYDMSREEIERNEEHAFRSFRTFINNECERMGERAVFVSDNVAFDWQWINHGFYKHLGYNPFGHSGRRISDFYAGLMGDWRNTQKWKKLRITKHDHNPVHDAIGNVEAFRRIMNGER